MSCSGAGRPRHPGRPGRGDPGPAGQGERGSSVPGASALTAAELRLLTLLSTHLAFPEVAGELSLSRNTVKSQANSIYRKLGASSRGRAVARSRELGLLTGGLAFHQGDDTRLRTLVECELEAKCMGQTARFQETLRKLAMIEEGFAEGEAFVLDPAATSALDPKTAALLQVAASAPSGRQWCAWNGTPRERWRQAPARTRSPMSCWRSSQWPGSAGPSPPCRCGDCARE